ncbi:MAG: hypothetical protein ACRC2U_19500 [Aeromonas sp.]
MQNKMNSVPRNLAGLTTSEQLLLNTAGCMLLREMLSKTRAGLDADWLAISEAKKIAICGIARQPREVLLTASLSSLSYTQREAIRSAVLALDYQGEFHCGCDHRSWHQAPVEREIGEIEREKKERTAKLAQRRAIAAALAIKQQGPAAIGQ